MTKVKFAMKLSDAQEGRSYFVMDGTGCHTLEKGDRVRVERGDLLVKQAGGWLPKGEWETLSATIMPVGALIDGAGI